MGCCKRSEVRVGSSPTAHRSLSFAILLVYQRYIESEIRLFVDDCVCYCQIKEKKDTVKLKNDIDRTDYEHGQRKWGIEFQSVKCNMMQLTRKQTEQINAEYT